MTKKRPDKSIICSKCWDRLPTMGAREYAWKAMTAEDYKRDFIPYFERAAELKKIFQTTCNYVDLYIDEEHRLFCIEPSGKNLVKKNNGRPMEKTEIFEFEKTSYAEFILDKVKVDGASAEGDILLDMIYDDPVMNGTYYIYISAGLSVEVKGFLGKKIEYDFPKKFLPVKSVFDNLMKK